MHEGHQYTVSEIYNGTYHVEWTREQGQAGMPWAAGVLRLEHHPELSPLDARGMGSDPGKYWQDQYTPQFWSATRRVIRAVSQLEYRIEEPELPDWATTEDRLAHARQWALHQRIWWDLTRRRVELVTLVREILATAITSGFYWGEHVCKPKVMTIPETGLAHPAIWMMPQWPKWRAPWSVRYWLTQREHPVGIIADFSQAMDYSYDRSRSWSVIPWTKLIHVASEQVGSNLEGVSWQRPVHNLGEMIREMYRVRALGAEISAIGEPIVTQPDGAVDEDDADAVDDWIVNRRAGQGGGIQLKNGWTVEFSKPNDSMPDLEAPITGLARDILMTLDAEDKGIAATGDVGAFAARENAEGANRAGWDYIALCFVVPVLEDIFRVGIEANFPADLAAGRIFLPTVASGPLVERDTGKWVDSVVAAKGGGLLDDPRYAAQVERELDLEAAEGLTDQGVATTANDEAGEQLMTPADIAARWGFRPSTVSGWIKAGKIAGSMVGGRWRARASAVAAFIDPDGDGQANVADDAASVQIAATEIMASEGDSRRDRFAVMIPVPRAIAEQLPTNKPHVTFVYIPSVDGRRDVAMAVLRQVLADKAKPCRVALDGLETMTNPKGEVVFYADVHAPWELYELRADLVAALQAEGFAVGFADEWRPHLTLTIESDPRAAFSVSLPDASWYVDTLEVWGDGTEEPVSMTAPLPDILAGEGISFPAGALAHAEALLDKRAATLEKLAGAWKDDDPKGSASKLTSAYRRAWPASRDKADLELILSEVAESTRGAFAKSLGVEPSELGDAPDLAEVRKALEATLASLPKDFVADLQEGADGPA